MAVDTDPEADSGVHGCAVCGGENRSEARFCRHCGAAVRPAAEAAAEPPPETVAAPPLDLSPARPRKRRTAVAAPVIAIAAAAVLAAVLLGWFLLKPRSGPPAAQAQTHYVTRLVRVRSAPTPEGSSVLASLNRGDKVSGVWITGADGTTPWLKIRRAGGADAYVWGRNLSPTPPPALARRGSPTAVALATNALIYADPQGKSVLQTLTAPVSAQAVGEVGGGWTEIALQQGGVGYVKSDQIAGIAGFRDPVEFCAGVGAADGPDARYTGPETPAWLATAMKRGPDGYVAWRCQSGAVLACMSLGITGPCSKRDLSQAPSEAMRQDCRREPNQSFLAAAITGHYTVYEWYCDGLEPRIRRQVMFPDAQGYMADEWQRVTRPPGA